MQNSKSQTYNIRSLMAKNKKNKIIPCIYNKKLNKKRKKNVVVELNYYLFIIIKIKVLKYKN